MSRRFDPTASLNAVLAQNPWLFVAIPCTAQLFYILLDPTHAYIYLGVLSEIGLKISD